MQATILTVKPTNNGGYLLALIGKDKVLCHQEFCDFDIHEARNGDVIDIGDVQTSERGLRGQDVRWVSRSGTVYQFVGTVSRVIWDRKCAFITPDDGGADIMAHITEFEDYRDGDSADFTALSNGARVSGYYTHTSRGLRGHDVRAGEGLSSAC